VDNSTETTEQEFVDLLLVINDYVNMEIVRSSEDSAPMEDLRFVANLTIFEEKEVLVDIKFENPL